MDTSDGLAQTVAYFARAALAGQSTSQILAGIAEHVARALDVPYSLIGRFVPNGSRMYVDAAYGWPQGESGRHSVPEEWCTAARAPITAPVRELGLDELPAALHAFGIQSALCVAIPGDPHPRGVLSVFSHAPRHFSVAEVTFLQSIAALITAIPERRSADSYPDVAHRQIVQAKREWEATVDKLPQLICLLDEHGRIMRANRTVEAWSLGHVADVKGKTLHDLLHPNCQNPLCYLHLLWRNEVEIGRHYNFIHEGEDVLLGRHLRIQLRAIEGQGGERAAERAVVLIEDVSELKLAEVVLRDANVLLERQVKERTSALLGANVRLQREIDERREIEAALSKSEARHRQLVETMAEGLAVYDVLGSIVYVNDSLCRILGFPREALVGQPAVRFLAAGCHWAAKGQVIDEPFCPTERYEAQWLRQDGTEIHVQVSPQRIDGPDGEPQGGFAVIMDITERKRSEEALRRSESELRLLSAQLIAAQELERKRIASELHDGINQSLSAMKFNLESCVALFDQGQAERGVQSLEAMVPKIQVAIEEVRRISMDLRPSTLDDLGILATIAWFCRELRHIYSHLEVVTEVQVREEEIPKPLKTVVYRILQEAVNNVIKHADARRVHVRLARGTSSIELAIQDDGKGFDPEAVAQREARGIGLSSMRERAEITGGRFECCSAPGQGSTVRIVWPCIKGATSQ